MMKLTFLYRMSFYAILAIFLLLSCEKGPDKSDSAAYRIKDIHFSTLWGGEPNLSVSPQGEVWFSWLEYLDNTNNALQYFRIEDGKPGEIGVVDTGSNWFVNWADFPSVVPFGDGTTLAAHWLQMSAPGTYDYDVHIAISKDGGKTWPTEFVPHDDGIPAEHGFVTMVPRGKDKMFAVWLDGRNTRKIDEEGNKGAMTLHAALFDREGNILEDHELDSRICDCCQTTAATTDEGVIVAYRNRSDEEVRDIFVTRQTGEGWSEPVAVHADNWLINGCPVNGPQLAVRGDRVALAWFTSADNDPRVNIAFSNNEGKTFSAPIRMNDNTALGRVDVAWINNSEVLLTWMESGDDSGIQLARLNYRGEIIYKGSIAKTDPGRKTGFPRLAVGKDGVFLSWTVVGESLTGVKLVQLQIP
jgi:hypothetical protein